MLTHKGTQELLTERLVLRRFTVEDAQAMYSNWATDELTARFMS
jgi:ribosomal-protein-alanine N-acetyltransferase